MMLEIASQMISAVLVLILVFFVLRYRNWKVAVVLVIGTIVLTNNGEADSNVVYAALQNLNAGFLTFLLYDYMKLVHERVVFRMKTQASALLEVSDYAIIGVDLDGTILAWNNAAERMFGLTERQAKGKNINIIVPDNKAQEHKQLMTSLKRGQGAELVTERCGADNTPIKVEVSIAPVRDPVDQSIIGGSAIYKEVSDVEGKR